jgi:hypothetical protein
VELFKADPGVLTSVHSCVRRRESAWRLVYGGGSQGPKEGSPERLQQLERNHSIVSVK